MSLPRSNYDPRRVCINPFPNLNLHIGKYRRTIGVYTAGGLFAFAHWLFLDAAVLSSHYRPPADAPYDTAPVHVTFVDWVPGILSVLGFLIVNMIDKDRIKGEEAYADPRAVWRARLILFIGFALMAGGLAGSVVSTYGVSYSVLALTEKLKTILVIKYVVKNYPERFTYYGYANVAQNISVMLSAVVLWMAQSVPSDYEYNLSI
ncbi:VPS68 [Sanghuangporus sanghuang]